MLNFPILVGHCHRRGEPLETQIVSPNDVDFHGKLETASLPFKEKCETVSAKTPCSVGKICTTST